MNWPTLADAAKQCKEFLKLNGVTNARFEPHDVIGKVPMIGSRDLLGQYVPPTKTIHVYADLCASSCSSWLRWSRPGFKSDISVLGVLAHETGHHFSHTWRGGLVPLRKAVRDCRELGEPPLTVYGGTSLDEDFCEAFKLFVTNPSLLELLRPVRYALLQSALKLRPVETRSWREILASSELHIRACEVAEKTKLEHNASWVVSPHEYPEECPK